MEQRDADDSVIVKDLQIMSQGKLVLNLDKVREDNLFEKLYREKKNASPRQSVETPRDNRHQRGGGGGQRPFNKNRRNNPHRRRDQ
jgi:hypothetical protein